MNGTAMAFYVPMCR